MRAIRNRTSSGPRTSRIQFPRQPCRDNRATMASLCQYREPHHNLRELSLQPRTSVLWALPD